MKAVAFAFLTVVLLQPGAAVEPQDRFFDSSGVRLRYIEQGQGPAIVLMHGYTGNADRHFVANGVLANLAKDHRAIAIDLRGHGKSAKPHTRPNTKWAWSPQPDPRSADRPLCCLC